jgi:hypothetical protein
VIMNKFDAANYKKHPNFIVMSDKDENYDSSNSLVLSAKLILVTWHPASGQPKSSNDKGKPLGTGIIRVSPLPIPIGTLPPTDFNIGIYSEAFVQFLDLSKIEVDYRLSFKNPKGITRTQVTIQEYVESEVYSNTQSVNSSPVIA